MQITVPYDTRTISAEIRADRSVTLLSSKEYHTSLDGAALVREALEHPIGSPRLSELAAQVNSVLLITNDITRPMPSKITIPALIEELERGNPHLQITILIASGLHRAMTHQELVDKMGEDIVNRYRVLVHDAYDKDSLVYKGVLPQGSPLWLNRAVDEHELVIAEGFIEAHWLAGFSGGRKSIMPGICGCETVAHNHRPFNVDHISTRPGLLSGNPAHEEFCEAARVAGLRFILNVVLDESKQISRAFAGDTFAAHEAGCAFVRELMEAPCEKADITVTSNSGYPLDLNLYQCVKGIDTASFATREDGVIIMCCGCREGVGHGGFLKVFQYGGTAKSLMERLHSGEIFEYDQWGSQLMLKYAQRFKVIIVSEGVSDEEVGMMFMDHVRTLPEAIALAEAYVGGTPTYNIIPEGPVIIPKISSEASV